MGPCLDVAGQKDVKFSWVAEALVEMSTRKLRVHFVQVLDGHWPEEVVVAIIDDPHCPRKRIGRVA